MYKVSLLIFYSVLTLSFHPIIHPRITPIFANFFNKIRGIRAIRGVSFWQKLKLSGD